VRKSAVPTEPRKQSPQQIIKVAIVGVTGYTGQELVRLLLLHENVEIKSAVSHSHNGKALTTIYPGLSKTNDLICEIAEKAA
jgi:N-acetyl-gamma-glutamylphosphate reductase